MGFLHKLWDETLAGPAPETGLGKLRKYNSFSVVRSPISPDQTPNVSRSITILRSLSSASEPASPAGPTTPTSPFSPSTPRADFKRFTKRKMSPDNADPMVYDWIVINALDR